MSGKGEAGPAPDKLNHGISKTHLAGLKFVMTNAIDLKIIEGDFTEEMIDKYDPKVYRCKWGLIHSDSEEEEDDDGEAWELCGLRTILTSFERIRVGPSQMLLPRSTSVFCSSNVLST